MALDSTLFQLFFAAEAGLPGIHSDHEPALRGVDCPDGSHLGVRDRARFTDALAALMKRRVYTGRE